jgi:uncharacterized phage protein (TIGR01671 family)
MREIKFRAWDKDNKEMIFWNLFNIDKDESFRLYIGDYGKRYEEDLEIMQYTGLYDKNGKEIYEGDIIRILYTDWPSKTDDDKRTLEEYKKDISKIGIVVYNSNGFYIRIKEYNDTLNEGRHGEKEIIGNIYENLELLEALNDNL